MSTIYHQRLFQCHQLRSNGHFPGEPGLASSLLVLFLYLFWKRTSGNKWHRFLTIWMLFLSQNHPTSSVKSLKEMTPSVHTQQRILHTMKPSNDMSRCISNLHHFLFIRHVQIHKLFFLNSGLQSRIQYLHHTNRQ